MKIKLFNYFISNEKSSKWYITKEDWDDIIFIRNYIFHWTTHIQYFLYDKGIYWHNWFTNECTPGFECCKNKLSRKDRNIIEKIIYACMEEIPIIYLGGKDANKHN